MRAFDRVFVNTEATSFGGLEGHALHLFSTQLAANPGFRAEKKNCLRDLYANRDQD